MKNVCLRAKFPNDFSSLLKFNFFDAIHLSKIHHTTKATKSSKMHSSAPNPNQINRIQLRSTKPSADQRNPVQICRIQFKSIGFISLTKRNLRQREHTHSTQTLHLRDGRGEIEQRGSNSHASHASRSLCRTHVCEDQSLTALPSNDISVAWMTWVHGRVGIIMMGKQFTTW